MSDSVKNGMSFEQLAAKVKKVKGTGNEIAKV